nr:heat stress transcription factor A-7A-like [Ipomoea batatas]
MELVRMQTEIDSPLGCRDNANIPVGLFATPRFLSKIFDMVEDPNTDSLVSWSSNGESFVIWDHNRFAAELLPKYFRHSNLASFIYQLNNYGFRKVNSERHEYENQWFRPGKKDWLKSIRSRVQKLKMLQKNGSFTAPVTEDLDVVMKKLKAEQIALRAEIQKLKEQQENMQKEFARAQEILENSDDDEERVISSFSLEFLQLVKRKARVDNEPGGSSSGSGKKKKSVEIQPEFQCLDEGKKEEEENARNAENSAFWKKIFEDDSDAENGGVEPLKDPKIMVELDDMMASKIAMEEGQSLISKVAGLEGEEDHEPHLQLWT